MKIRYTFRLRPGADAERALMREEGRNRWVWNQAVAARRAGAPYTDAALTEAREEHPWLAEGSVVAQQQTLRDFRVAKQPHRKFRSKRSARPTLNFTRRGFAIKSQPSGPARLVIAKGIVLPVVWSRTLPSDPSSVRIYRDPIGHWWGSFVVERPHTPSPVPESASIGIDWGVAQIATTTNPQYDLPHPRLSRKHAAQLAAAQRRMARRKPAPGKPASHGYQQAKHQAAKIHEHVRNARREVARSWAARVARDHTSIAVEDFRPGFLSQSTMARVSADAGIGIAKRTIIEYAEREGRQLKLIKPAYTTMDCSACGTRAKTQLSLSQRVYVCEACGATLGRDLNAARNILARAGFDPAGADAVDGVANHPVDLSRAEPEISRPRRGEESSNRSTPSIITAGAQRVSRSSRTRSHPCT